MIDDFEEIFAFSFLITVNNDAHGFRFRIARAAANQRVFATFDIARGKRQCPLIDRHAAFIFLNAASHFSE